ncbi:MAG: choice-of-anchor K domain-containing protein, partial [Cyanobacteriota bacterium]
MQLTKRFLASQVLIIAALSEACIAATVAPTTRFQGTTAGVFTNNDAGVVNGIGTNSFSWGIGQPNRSNLTFAGGLFDVNVRTGYVYGPRARNDAEVFSLGSLSYYNGTITGGSGANSVQLNVTSSVTSPVGTNPATFPIPFTLINSSNTNDPIASADSVFLPRNLPPVVTQTPGNYPITLEVPGFGQTTGSGFSTLDKFFVLEDGTASASLLGRLVPACEPIVTGAVSVTPNGATMSAAFTPKFGLTTSQAAS